MKKIFIIILTCLTLGLFACEENKEHVITVIASQTPHSEILEQARPLLKEKGFDLKVTITAQYDLVNQATAQNQYDANFFQHIPYLQAYNETVSNSNRLYNAANIHLEPLGIYSNKYTSLDNIEQNEKVIISSSISDHLRFLQLLSNAGLIVINENADLTTTTFEEKIKENLLNLNFVQIKPELCFQALQANEGGLVFINTNYAMQNDLKPKEDAIYLESTNNNPYVNIIAVKESNKETAKTKALVDVLTSQLIKDFINNEYNGFVIAV